MAEVLLFHHAQGLTAGVRSFAGALRARGHVVHTPDLYEGRTFAGLDEGVAHAEEVGFDTIIGRGRAYFSSSAPKRMVSSTSRARAGSTPASVAAASASGERPREVSRLRARASSWA